MSLDLENALTAEAASTQNLIPDTPGWNELTSRPAEFASWLSGQLQRGYTPARQAIVNVRKLGYGIRPVSILAIPDRVLYRALVSHILRDFPPVRRDTATFLEFLVAPVEAARREERAKKPPDRNAKKVFFSALGSSIYTHVVKSDIVAYYQYVDHGILGNELFNLSSEYKAIEVLLEFLLEVQGRGHGIPQLLDPSDELSEIYIQILVRALLRNGLPTWSFSDDLRILCKSYEESRWAIEILNGSASDIGLAINESKTSTPRFATYVMETTGVAEDEEIGEDAEPDAEANIGEYTEFYDDDQTADSAVAVLASAQFTDNRSSNNEPLILLQKVSAESLRAIRRAIARLRSLDDDRGLEHVVRIVPFLAVITPTACRYLIKLCESGKIREVSAAFDTLIQNELSPWQSQWFIHVARSTDLLKRRIAPAVGARIAWVKKLQGSPHSDPATRAEATLALASTGDTDRKEINTRLMLEPDCLKVFYLRSAAELLNRSADLVERKQIAALAGSVPFQQWLVGMP